MTISRRKIWIFLSFVLAIALTGGGLTFFLHELYHLDKYKTVILKELRQSLNRDVQYEKGGFSLLPGPTFTFSHVLIKERGRDEAEPLMKAERVSFRLAGIPFLMKKVVIREIILENPFLRLDRLSDGTFNISDLLERKKEQRFQVKALRIQGGAVLFTDRYVAGTAVPHRFEKVNLYISNLRRGKKTRFNIRAVSVGQRGESILNISGKGKITPEDRPFFDTVFDARIQGENIHAGRYWDYYRRYVPFEKILGSLDVDATFKGRLKAFESAGKVKIRGLSFHYPQVFHAVLAPKDLHFTYSMALSSRDVTVESIDFFADGFHARGRCAILDIPSGDPRIVAYARTEPFKLENHFKYIPFGIIPKETSEFIEQKIKSATCRLDEGRLDGRVSRIARMWEGDNNRVLSIRGTILEGGLLQWNEKVPSFNAIKGELLLEGKDFTLRNMSGKFGTSPFTLNGKITDYCLETPKSYPFSMIMTPLKPEVAWLTGRTADRKLSYSGPSTLRLNGAGFTDDYRLSGDWLLDRTDYGYGEVIRKRAGKANRIVFDGRVNHEGFTVSSLRYALPLSTLDLSGRYGWGEKKTVAVEARSNQIRLEEAGECFPVLGKIHPKGQIRLSIQGNGNTDDLLGLNWRGGISLNDTSFVVAENVKPVRNLSGMIRLKEDSLEMPHISALVGSNVLTGKARLASFRNPILNVDFTCPQLDLGDIGLIDPTPLRKLTGIKGSLSWRDDTLHVKTLSGRVGNSFLQLKGSVSDLKKPVMVIQATSSYLEIEDVEALARIRTAKKKSESPDSVEMKVDISAATGTFRGFPFTGLHADLIYAKRFLNLKALETETMGGKVSAKGRIDMNGPITRYQTEFAVDGIASEELIKRSGWKNALIVGSLSAQGELAARGETVADLKKTAQGRITVNMGKGVIRDYPILSKIFSILNVSQLFKFQLPDMVSDGMPYNEMKAAFTFQDGFVSTNDLFVKSNAMNIAAVGKTDLIREEIDATFGIQPLQTVDKIVSRIPVVGWIITGKEGTFVTTYFQAKGKLNNPTVTAIPLQAMATGVFDIFKRVFQLPVKIFTNTGEVLIGN